MKPYVESGRAAQKNLQTRAQDLPEQRRLYGSLRGLKQVINTVGVCAIMLIALIGVITRDPVLAAGMAVNFLIIICVLEVIERGVKRDLAKLKDRSEASA